MNRKKGLNRFMCLLLTIVFLLPTGTIVNAFSASIGINKYEMDAEQIIIQKYIITDNGEVQLQASIPIGEIGVGQDMEVDHLLIY